MSNNGEITAEQEAGWQRVENAAKEAAIAYATLIKASDALASAMEYREDFVLRHVLPRHADDRRKITRILEWVTLEKGTVMKALKEREENHRWRCSYDALMERLQLTAEEKTILGISPDAS